MQICFRNTQGRFGHFVDMTANTVGFDEKKGPFRRVSKTRSTDYARCLVPNLHLLPETKSFPSKCPKLVNTKEAK